MNSKEVLKRLSALGFIIKPHQVAYYLKLGIIKPWFDAKGRGKVRYFSEKNMVDIAIAASLQEIGFTLPKIKALIESLSEKRQ